jgi:hypothetical protein
MKKLSLERLREVLSYDADTGLFTWRVKHAHAHAIAGAKDYHGYCVIRIDGTLYKAHRLAWLYTYGEWPAKGLDHKNQVKDDNRISNLREVTQSENMHNVKPRSNSKSGVSGVVWRSDRNKWNARIKVGYKTFNLGLYANMVDAIEARKAAENRLLAAV